MSFPEGQFCGTFPHKMIERLEKKIYNLEAYIEILEGLLEIDKKPLTNQENMSVLKVEGEFDGRDLGDI